MRVAERVSLRTALQSASIVDSTELVKKTHHRAHQKKN